MPVDVVAIDHVQIAVPRAQVAECLSFCRTILCLAEIERAAALKVRGGAWSQVGALQLHVGIDPKHSPKSKRHVCFLVTSLERPQS
jgi:hypothetical protein